MIFSILNKLLLSYNIIAPVIALFHLQWLNSMANYTYFLSSIVSPLSNICAIIPIIGWHKYNNYELYNPIKQIYLFVIGLLEYIGLLFTVISVSNIPYLYTLIFGKSIIILMILSNYIFLNRRYYLNHYLGAFIIVTGIFISSIPLYFNKNESLHSNIGYLLLYILSLFIHVINYTFREKFIKKEENLNVFVMNFYINIWQLFIGIICFPIIMIPIKEFSISYHDFSTYLSNALSCQFLQKSSLETDNCDYSLLWLLINQGFYIFITYFLFEIVKKGSSVLLIIQQNILCAETSAFIAYIFYKYNIIVDVNKSEKIPLYAEDYISLFLVLLGLAIYLQKPEYTFEIDISCDYSLMNDLYPETPESISKIPFENPMVSKNPSIEEYKIFSRHSTLDMPFLEESKSEIDERINVLFDETEYKI